MRTFVSLCVMLVLVMSGCSHKETPPAAKKKVVELRPGVTLEYDAPGVLARLGFGPDGEVLWFFSGSGEVDVINRGNEEYHLWIPAAGQREWQQVSLEKGKTFGFMVKPEWDPRQVRLPSEK